jgi:hypothetical protein
VWSRRGKRRRGVRRTVLVARVETRERSAVVVGLLSLLRLRLLWTPGATREEMEMTPGREGL